MIFLSLDTKRNSLPQAHSDFAISINMNTTFDGKTNVVVEVRNVQDRIARTQCEYLKLEVNRVFTHDNITYVTDGVYALPLRETMEAHAKLIEGLFL